MQAKLSLSDDTSKNKGKMHSYKLSEKIKIVYSQKTTSN